MSVDMMDLVVLVCMLVPVVLVGVAVQVDEIGGQEQGPIRQDPRELPKR
jgi:hypothetical protein